MHIDHGEKCKIIYAKILVNFMKLTGSYRGINTLYLYKIYFTFLVNGQSSYNHTAVLFKFCKVNL